MGSRLVESDSISKMDCVMIICPPQDTVDRIKMCNTGYAAFATLVEDANFRMFLKGREEDIVDDLK